MKLIGLIPCLVLLVLDFTVATKVSKCVCSDPLDPGPCLAAIPRFYYCAKSKTCKEFVYGGCKGNGNNFETFESCIQQCHRNETALPCHHAADPGPCKAYIDRFYYDIDTNQCMLFKYGGCAGNSNNFEELQDCQNACINNDLTKPPMSQKVCQLPVVTGPCKGYFPRFYFDGTSRTCKQFIYGGCGGNMNNFLSLADCRKACSRPQDDVCTLPAFTGPCRAAFKRFYFDTTTGSCKEFVYGGCQSNGNNFETVGECEAKCGPVKVNPCEVEKKVGPCKAAINRYYYDQEAGKCLLFSWGGCQPNENNFLTLENCQKVCPDTSVGSSGSDPCNVEVQAGPCFGAFPRFYYNKATKTCDEFSWGGCQANGNNFLTQNECVNQCLKKNPTKKTTKSTTSKRPTKKTTKKSCSCEN